MNIDPLRQAIQALSGTFKSLQLYPAKHPAVEKQIGLVQLLLQRLFADKPSLKLGLVEGVLYFEEYLAEEKHVAATEVARVLESMGVEALEFTAGLQEHELLSFLELAASGQAKGARIASLFEKQGIRNIRILSLRKKKTEEGTRSARTVYNQALKVMDDIFRDVRLGIIPSMTETFEVIREMTRITLDEPHSLFALSLLKDYDQYTFTHSVNVSIIALAVGRACELPPERLRQLGLGGLLHDLGKLEIDLSIIAKPGRLSPEELSEIRKHPLTGVAIVQRMEGVPEEVVEIVRCHHLHFDRSGYPLEALERRSTPLADMVAIADTYDAITTLRVYQRPMTPRRAIERMRQISGSHLHPEYLQKFIASLGEYPVGSLVRLTTNEIGLVTRVGSGHSPQALEIKLIFDAKGRRLSRPGLVHLMEYGAEIVSEVDPLSKGIDVADFID